MSKRIGLRIMIFFGLLILTDYIDLTKCLDVKFQQHDYQMKFEREELVRYNKAYINYYKMTTFKYNRTSPVVNVTFQYNIDVGNELEIVVQAYTFLSNEYRLFPIRFEASFCEGISKNYGGLGSTTKCGNFSGCPMKKGVWYQYCNWSPDQSQFPPLIPNGRYMIELQGYLQDIEIFLLRGYGIVDRPIPIPTLWKNKSKQ